MYLKLAECNFSDYDVIVIGAGFSGVVTGRAMADIGKKVLIVDAKTEIGGMMADYIDSNGICIHKYGPHVFMINSDLIIDYLKKYSVLVPVTNYVYAYINNKYVSIPINFKSLDTLYGEKRATILKEKLIKLYGLGNEVHILTMRNSDDPVIRELADELYNNIFVGYNTKMWGLLPEELDPSIPGRLPIRVSYNNKNCKKKYELIPRDGYKALFKSIVCSENIDILLNCKASEFMKIEEDSVWIGDKFFGGIVICTGPLDEMFGYCYGELPYRAIHFEIDVYNGDSEAPGAVTTFPMNYYKVRTTDMVVLLDQKKPGFVANVSEYPGRYDRNSEDFNVPAYPVLNVESISLINRYKELADKVKNFYYVGRLAEFKYFDMEATIGSALKCVDRIIKKEGITDV